MLIHSSCYVTFINVDKQFLNIHMYVHMETMYIYIYIVVYMGNMRYTRFSYGDMTCLLR